MDGSSQTRRSFLINLGAGTGAIAGYFLLPPRWSAAALPETGAAGSAHPRLHSRVATGRSDDLDTLSLDHGGQRVVCAFNRPGALIVRHLDGRHTVRQISTALGSRLNIPADEALAAKTAEFIARLAMLGFMAEPYYATIVTNGTVTHDS